MIYRQQFDASDCGAACLAMIASYFNKKLSVAEIRVFAGTDSEGTNVKGLLEAARKYQLKARAVKGEHRSIVPGVPTPFIAHMHITRNENNCINHYVVVKKISEKKIEIWDPDPLYKDSIQYMKPEKIEGNIKFEDVTFAYGSRRPVYEHLSLEIPAGSWTAFVGPSGSGKSTFVKLIGWRLY